MKCYVLVGGRSRRMGRSKVDLPFGSSTFLDRVTAAAFPLFDEIVAVQRAGGATVGELRTIFEEDHEQDGPVFGVMRALQDAERRCFVVAVDYPLITTEILDELARRFRASRARMLVPIWRGRAQMLCAGYDASLAETLASRIAAGKYDLRGLIDEVGAEVVAETELRRHFAGEPLMNVNTPEELEEARRLDGR